MIHRVWRLFRLRRNLKVGKLKAIASKGKKQQGIDLAKLIGYLRDSLGLHLFLVHREARTRDERQNPQDKAVAEDPLQKIDGVGRELSAGLMLLQRARCLRK